MVDRFERYKAKHGQVQKENEHCEECPLHQALDLLETVVPEAMEYSNEKKTQKLVERIENVIAGERIQDGIAALFFALQAQVEDAYQKIYVPVEEEMQQTQ